MRMMRQKMIKKISVVAIALLATGVCLHAQTEPIKITTTAVPFLRITPDARSGGMANMGLATSADANAMFHNLAKTVFTNDKMAFSANYTPWLRNAASDIFLASLSGYMKHDDNQAFTASFRYFNIGDIPIVDYSGAKLSTYRPNEFAADFGYSRKLSNKISMGAAIRYIYSKMADGKIDGVTYSAGNAVAGDVSVYYNGIDEN